MTYAKHIRWSDNDTYWGPFVYSKDKYNKLAFVLGSGDDQDYPGCRLRIQGFGRTLIITLPQIIQPWRKKVIVTTWDEATIKRLGRDWYWDTHEREYGFSLSDSGDVGSSTFLQVFLGRQTHDSSTTQNWCCSLPWTDYRHVRHCFYDLKGDLFWTEPKHIKGTPWNHESWYKAKDECPTRSFAFADFDGEQLIAKTRIEERQWNFGTGWFKWLQYLRKPIIHRSLDIEFSGETGKRKGSWKGGTIGHAINMLPDELHEAAFRRYCVKHQMTYRGEGVWIEQPKWSDDQVAGKAQNDSEQ